MRWETVKDLRRIVVSVIVLSCSFTHDSHIAKLHEIAVHCVGHSEVSLCVDHIFRGIAKELISCRSRE